jgi:hypothetical protein
MNFFFNRIVCLESSQLRSCEDGNTVESDEYHDLYIVTGHEASF